MSSFRVRAQLLRTILAKNVKSSKTRFWDPNHTLAQMIKFCYCMDDVLMYYYNVCNLIFKNSAISYRYILCNLYLSTFEHSFIFRQNCCVFLQHFLKSCFWFYNAITYCTSNEIISDTCSQRA